MSAPWLTLIGLGEDGRDGLSARANEALGRAEAIVGGRRHLALIGATRAEQIAWASPIEATFPLILARRPRPVCVVASGDPFFYGIGSVLARQIPADEMRCLPQASAFSLAASRLGWALQDCELVSLHGRPLDRIVSLLRPGARVLALSWDAATPMALAALLTQRGFGRSVLTVFEAMGGPRERLRSGLAAAFDVANVDPLNTVAIAIVADPHARLRPLTTGLPDAWFEHDGQITKARVRAVTLSALAPQPGELLWDIGAGSGSIGIEWMLTHPSTRTIAIEREPGRVERIGRNARALGVPDLHVIEGAAPAALKDLPAPQAIVIGGGVTAPDMLDRCRDALDTGGRLVVNAVTIESQGVIGAAFAAHGGELATLSFARAEPVGRFNGWRTAMPVMQWVWIKR